MRAPFLLLLYLLGISLVNINVVTAVSRTISVDASQEEVRSVDLKVDDKVSGRVSVIGDSSDDIDFYVTNPSGNVVVKRERVSVKDFSFTASRQGTYKLHFDNKFSTEAKTVSYNYDVRHFIFGIPQEDFLVFLVMIVAVVGLVLFVRLSRP